MVWNFKACMSGSIFSRCWDNCRYIYTYQAQQEEVKINIQEEKGLFIKHSRTFSVPLISGFCRK